VLDRRRACSSGRLDLIPGQCRHENDYCSLTTLKLLISGWVQIKEKVHTRCCHWFYRCFAFASSSCVTMAQSKRKCVFVAKFHTSSLSQYNDVFVLAVKHDWKAFATVKSRVANFKQHFGIRVKIWKYEINKSFSDR